MIQVISLGFTSLLTLYVVLWQKRSGPARMWVMGTAFFVISFYLDSVFRLIMGSAAEAGYEQLFGGLGIMVSKGILSAGLFAARIMVHEPQEREASGGWQYLDGLTVCVNLFFLLSGIGIMYAISGMPALDVPGQGGFGAALLLAVLLAILLAYHGSLYIHRRKLDASRARSEAEARRREADVYLESAENQYQRTRELWHDLKNHISLLSMLLADGKYEEMADYLRIFGDDVDSLTLPVKSGNLVVDALLADKLAKAGKEGIKVSLSLCDLSDLSLRPDELCSLFGNLLDNALEANRLAAEGRFLEVDCRKREDYYYIKVANAAVRAKNRKGVLQTRKSDLRNKVGHGLGLRSIERVVHGCGGEFAVDSSENRFTAVVRLPR